MGRSENTGAHGLAPRVQEHPMSCGVACLALIADWATGLNLTESDVRRQLGLRSTEHGVPERKMRDALSKARRRWRIDFADTVAPPRLRHPDTVHLLLVASYDAAEGAHREPANVAHWILVRDLRVVCKQRTGTKPAIPRGGSKDHVIGRVADPLALTPVVWGERREPQIASKATEYFQSWDSLMAMPTLHRFDVTRRRGSKRVV